MDDVRAKLIKLIATKSCFQDIENCVLLRHKKFTDCSLCYCGCRRIGEVVDHLIENGVTVGKPLEGHLRPIDAYEGLKGKYLVFKADTGERVENCFVLRPDKDKAAVEALRAYAEATDNKILSEDIYNWVGSNMDGGK